MMLEEPAGLEHGIGHTPSWGSTRHSPGSQPRVPAPDRAASSKQNRLADWRGGIAAQNAKSLVPAEPNAECNRDEFHISARSKHVVESALDKQPDAACLEVEACAAVEPNLVVEPLVEKFPPTVVLPVALPL